MSKSKLILPDVSTKKRNSSTLTSCSLKEESNQPFIRIPNDHVLYRQLKPRFNQLLGLNNNNERFPGALPCSLMRADISKLYHGKLTYCVTEKQNGTRGLLFFTLFKGDSFVLFIDRAFNMFLLVDLVAKEKVHEGTILDVEHVVTSDKHTFWVFDTLAKFGESLLQNTEAHYINRHITAKVIVEHLLLFGHDVNGFEFKVKKPYPLYNLKRFMEVELPKRQQESPTDGIILTPLETLYQPGQDVHLFKYKVGNDNTADFLLKYQHAAPDEKSPQPLRKSKLTFSSICLPVELYCDDRPRAPAPVFYCMSVIHIDKLKEYGCDGNNKLFMDHKIVEARLQDGEWIVEKIRFDKKTPNHRVTIEKCQTNVEENITLKELYCQCHKCTQHTQIHMEVERS